MGNEASIYRFGEIEVREREFSLTKAGEVLPVEPKAFRVRLILPRNPQMLITKTELLSAVWGDAADPENWTEPQIGNAISPRLENHIVLGSADEDALEQQGWEQTALVPPRQIHPDPHGRDERGRGSKCVGRSAFPGEANRQSPFALRSDWLYTPGILHVPLVFVGAEMAGQIAAIGQKCTGCRAVDVVVVGIREGGNGSHQVGECDLIRVRKGAWDKRVSVAVGRHRGLPPSQNGLELALCHVVVSEL